MKIINIPFHRAYVGSEKIKMCCCGFLWFFLQRKSA